MKALLKTHFDQYRIWARKEIWVAYDKVIISITSDQPKLFQEPRKI
jgi:hypothetical protein